MTILNSKVTILLHDNSKKYSIMRLTITVFRSKTSIYDAIYIFFKPQRNIAQTIILGRNPLYRVFKKEGEKVNGYYATKIWILGAI